MPMMRESCGRSRFTTSRVFTPGRSAGGLSAAAMKPPPAEPPPEKPTTVAMAGSARTMSMACASLSPSALDEMLWSARMPAISWPLSWSGKKPLVMAENRYTLSPMTTPSTATTSQGQASAQSSAAR